MRRVTVILLLFASGCDVSPGANTDPKNTDAAAAVCESGFVEALFAQRCATSDCHSRSARQSGIDLQSSGVLQRLAATRGNCDRTRMVVDATNAARSLLLEKLDRSTMCGSPMPPSGPLLSEGELACVRAWISSIAIPSRDASVDVDQRNACERSDGDGDGFGTDLSCARRDCNDSNLSIFPGAAEACNGIDDNCDGATDEGFAETTCGEGACQRVAPICREGRYTACVPGTPTAETCNGIDDDCDGMTDEGVSTVSCGVGRCRREAACTGGRPGTCVPATPSAETCNNEDDDCDGTIDEGLRAEGVATMYPLLAMRHDACTGTGERIGPNCNAAIHRFCSGRVMACMTSGFGPVENSYPAAQVTCVRGTNRMTTYSTLTMQLGACNGSSERIGPACNAAIHRWCRSNGFATGFGPVENSGDDAYVVCLSSQQADVVNSTYTELARSHPGCTAATRIGADCNAAIHRLCRSRGFVSGYGPVENSGDTSVVVCVRE
jgi:hypothetical protein